MRLHRFIIEQDLLAERLVVMDEALLHQWLHVLRYEEGAEVLLLDGKGKEVRAKLVACSKKEVQLEIVERFPDETEQEPALTLYFSPLKRELTELVLQKGTELGVSVFQPILCERTVKDHLNQERLTRILKEAVEQSGRRWLPTLQEPIAFKEAVVGVEPSTSFFASLQASGESLQAPKDGSIALFVGPEGGWTEAEERLAKERSLQPLCLSRHVLRAETACIVGVGRLLATS